MKTKEILTQMIGAAAVICSAQVVVFLTLTIKDVISNM